MTRGLIAACLVLFALLGVQTIRLSDEQRDHAETREDHAQALAAMNEAARQAEAEARAEEQRRTAEVQKAADEAHHALERARADAAAADAAGQRLRERIAALTTACRAGPGGAGAATPGTPADPAADLLADVQRRLDEAADGIAAHADAARAAGAACERAYDAVRSTPR